MALGTLTNSTLGRFGIKEVADVGFYNVGKVKINSDTGEVEVTENPVLTFDTLKVSSLEFTGETAEARGGKGNTVLMSWDHSREATMTLEDALLSMDTLHAMLSNKALVGDANTERLTITADGFPGEYTVVGQTYARSAVDGKDYFLTFVIYRAKVQSEASFEMSADGDPSTLNLTLKVLRAEKNADIGTQGGEMVEFIIKKNSTNNPTVVLPTVKQ